MSEKEYEYGPFTFVAVIILGGIGAFLGGILGLIIGAALAGWLFEKSNKNIPPTKVAASKLSTTFSTLSESIDTLNDSIDKSQEADKRNKHFLSELDSFMAQINKAVYVANYQNEIEKFKIKSDQHKELYEKHTQAKKDNENETVKLVFFKPGFGLMWRQSHEGHSVFDQRIEKIHDCLEFIEKLQKKLTGQEDLLQRLDKITHQSFERYLEMTKNRFISLIESYSKYPVLPAALTDLATLDSITEYTANRTGGYYQESYDKLPAGIQPSKHIPPHEKNELLSEAEIRKQKIKALVAKRNIKALVHFTRIENLPSIIQQGLIGRNDLESKNIDVEINDKLRLDNATNAISTSISFPNYKMFYSYQKKSPSADWAVIKLDPCILWELDCAFNITNAAAKTTSKIPLEDRKTFEALEQMFDDRVGTVRDRLKLNIPENYPTDPQAEVLILDTVNPKHIQSICLNEKTKINNLPLVADKIGPFLSSVNFFFEPRMFAPRLDYEHWLTPSNDALSSEQENPYIRHFDF